LITIIRRLNQVQQFLNQWINGHIRTLLFVVSRFHARIKPCMIARGLFLRFGQLDQLWAGKACR